METYKDRILVETAYIGANVSCISTRRGLVLVDSPFMSRDAKDWSERIRAATEQDIAYVINTDHHYDHVMGNAFLTGNVICHSRAAMGLDYFKDKALLKNVIKDAFPDIMDDLESEIEDLNLTPPHITFDRRLTLDMGDATIILEFVGGHSPGTILIYLVEERTVFTGDNVEAQFPYFGQARFRSWREAIRKILSMQVDIVVPGHGPVGGMEMVERYDAFFQSLEEEVERLDSKGMTADEMLKESKAVRFFPHEEMSGTDLGQSFLGQQYLSAARAILAERPDRRASFSIDSRNTKQY